MKRKAPILKKRNNLGNKRTTTTSNKARKKGKTGLQKFNKTLSYKRKGNVKQSEKSVISSIAKFLFITSILSFSGLLSYYLLTVEFPDELELQLAKDFQKRKIAMALITNGDSSQLGIEHESEIESEISHYDDLQANSYFPNFPKGAGRNIESIPSGSVEQSFFGRDNLKSINPIAYSKLPEIETIGFVYKASADNTLSPEYITAQINSADNSVPNRLQGFIKFACKNAKQWYNYIPCSLQVFAWHIDSKTGILDLSDSFQSITGDRMRLAIYQLVMTVLNEPGVEKLKILINGKYPEYLGTDQDHGIENREWTSSDAVELISDIIT